MPVFFNTLYAQANDRCTRQTLQMKEELAEINALLKHIRMFWDEVDLVDKPYFLTLKRLLVQKQKFLQGKIARAK